MPWSKSYESKDPETGKSTTIKHKTDEEGYVSDVMHGIEQDKEGGQHGHVWDLNSDIPDNPDDDSIDGRDLTDNSGSSVYDNND